MSAAFSFYLKILLVKFEREQFYGKEKCEKHEGLWTERL